MKSVQITNSSSGSIGMISRSISEALKGAGIENRIYITYQAPVGTDTFKYASDREVKWNSLKSHVSGNYGFHSRRITERLINELESYAPDLVHIHNIHGHDVNVELLFQYLQTKQIPVIYTFHDCWAFTGYCPHYAYAGCEQWKTECNTCPIRKRFSFFFDHSSLNFQKKQRTLEPMNQLTIVTPSQWMKDQVGQSFLRDKQVTVIPNGIDLQVFHPASSDIKKELGITKQYVLLNIANQISSRKGYDDLVELSARLPEEFQLVMLGLKEQEISELPEGILGLQRVSDTETLVKLYSMADAFVNPTHEDTFPTVNIESIACGTPVVTYQTGGSPEIIDANTGKVVKEYDVEGLTTAVIDVAEHTADYSAACRARALALFDKERCLNRYLELYKQLLNH
ncbi:MAG: glycosyltransferase [Solobacterium sp.]|nr:glycosyltransferase [Solobacterium sp.]